MGYNKVRVKFFNNKFLFVACSVVLTSLVLIGHSLTVPVRGQVTFGANYANNQDGTRYAEMALEIIGLNEEASCKMVEAQWDHWQHGDLVSTFCENQGDEVNKVYDTYYKSRILYPYLIAFTYPILGLTSMIFWVLIFFLLLTLIQIRFLLVLNTSLAANLAAILTLNSSSYYIKQSLSVAATDLILSALVILIFFAIYNEVSPVSLVILTVLINILSVLNKQTQIFWIVLALLIFIQTLFVKIEYSKSLRLMSVITIWIQITSIFIVEKIWQSFTILRGNKIGLISDDPINVVTLINKFYKIAINDLATITTKNIPTLLIFIFYMLIVIQFLPKFNKLIVLNQKYMLVIVFLVACLAASFTNAFIIGVGNLNLRMYLPILSVSVVPMAICFDNILRRLSVKSTL